MAAKINAELIFFVDAELDRLTWLKRQPCIQAEWHQIKSKGYLESVHDDCLKHVSSDYVLRLDDDERCSPAMIRWLAAKDYLKSDHWKFPRIHFWRNVRSVLLTPHLYPDFQTRLSVRAKASGRRTVHAGSPFGGGTEAPVAIEHYKFIVKTYEERRQIALGYDAFHPGFGTGSMLPFSLPEDAYDTAMLVGNGDGTIPWVPTWKKVISLKDQRVSA